MLANRASLVAKLLDCDPEARHGDRVEQSAKRKEPVVLERSPLAVLALGHIGNDGMEVQIGLLVAIGIMLEKADREIASRNGLDLASVDKAGFSGILLGPCERLCYRLAIGSNDPLILSDQGQQRPAFG